MDSLSLFYLNISVRLAHLLFFAFLIDDPRLDESKVFLITILANLHISFNDPVTSESSKEGLDVFIFQGFPDDFYNIETNEEIGACKTEEQYEDQKVGHGN